MQVYQKTIIVQPNDLDELNHVNNVRYVKWVQDIAKQHWQQNVTSEISEKYFWVVLSHYIEYKNAALLKDQILLKTFVTKSEGVTSIRIVEMYRQSDNKLLVRAETNWCLMDKQTKRPTRITSEISKLFN